VRLFDLGVHAPEAYTLPTAVVLVLVGLDRLRRDPDGETVPALLPGLALATVPSLLWVLVDPVSTRAVLLGLACLVILLAGTALRWTAPVLVGWAVGGLLVLRELWPYAAETPQWILIGSAGTLLIGVGITWEARLRDLRQAAGYLGRLR
jgi:cell division protein FtsW (lipid II flippase)